MGSDAAHPPKSSLNGFLIFFFYSMAKHWSPSPVAVLTGTPLDSLAQQHQADVQNNELSADIEHGVLQLNQGTHCNIVMEAKHLEWLEAVSLGLEFVKPTAVCCICAKILYPHQIKWVPKFPQQLWKAQHVIPEHSPVNIKTSMFPRKGECVSACSCCESKIKSGKYETFDFLDTFGKVPECFKNVRSYAQFRKLSIANIYCSTYTNPGYSYLHARGNVSFSLNTQERLGGMIGMMQNGDEVQLESSNYNIKQCLLWMKKKNFLYKRFLSSLETIHGYAETKFSGGLFCGLPTTTPNLHIQDDGPVPASFIKKQKGLLFPAHSIQGPKAPIDIGVVPIGKQVALSEANSNKTDDTYANIEKVTYSDPNLEAKIFPQLFPYGLGSWKRSTAKGSAFTIGAYHKHRLLHADRRWANDRFYPFFAFDRNMKARIFYINNVLATNKNRDSPITSSNLIDKECYYKYGNVMNSTITGSKAYWQKQYLDLVARVSAHGPGDVFFTVTFNESWKEVKEINSQYKSKASIHHPVEPTVYFFERYKVVKDLIEGKHSVFCEVEHVWHRVESQNRGALHIHGILWLKEGTFKKDSIVAEIPRGEDKLSKELRQLVRKLQVHACRPNRCFRTSKGKTMEKCKYGFPFDIRESDGHGEGGIKYEYRRTEKEDCNVVPYNPILLLAWRGHINVQRITNTGLERYLVKYVSKIEPSFTVGVENESEVSKYLESRLIGAPEAVAMMLSYPMVDSNTSVVFLDTNMPNQRSRPLRPKIEIEELDPDSTDIFVHGAREHYMNRPKTLHFESMTYPRYTCEYRISKNLKLRRFR